ncbi:MAG: hypothetical protein ISS70_23130 [Phycisphaerae bacterium]|nr:hypothetical protein [Phycisphaerae bacterium]
MDFNTACRTFSRGKQGLFEEASYSLIQIAAKGLAWEEVAEVAVSLANSGKRLHIPIGNAISPVDTPSTGGPASMSTLFCPLLIADAGVPVPKISLRGSIAGAIDTMAVIPGFKYRLSDVEFVQAIESAGIAHSEPGPDFCPADKTLMSCRRKLGQTANPWLAAASLLAKKLAIPNTAAAFDFRVGPTGNIGSNINEAQRTADIFFGAAEKLAIPICITLTDNSCPSCSAIGRLESLNLLWQVLTNPDTELELDRTHVDTCIEIAAQACVLAKRFATTGGAEKVLRDRLRSGKVRRMFVEHLEAQGSTLEAFERVIQARTAQDTLQIVSPSQGFWVPPNLTAVKNFAKYAQARVEETSEKCSEVNLNKQFGMRLLVTPGERTEPGQPVVEIRYPHRALLQIDTQMLAGSTVSNPQPKPTHVFKHLFPRHG